MIVEPERDAPGNQRERLRDADFQCVGPRHVVDGRHARLRGAAIDPQNDQTADDERHGHRHGEEQIRLDELVESEPQHRQRNEGDDEIRDEAPRRRIAREALQHAREAHAVFPHDREHRAALDHDVEYLGFVVVETEQLTRNDQVPGARDRQELGQTFDDAQYEGLKIRDGIHRALS